MAKVKAVVEVMLKPEVLDPQGKAVLGALRSLGFQTVTDVRVGKLIEVELEGERHELEAKVKDMCEKLLANTVIERYKFHLG